MIKPNIKHTQNYYQRHTSISDACMLAIRAHLVGKECREIKGVYPEMEKAADAVSAIFFYSCANF